MKVLLVDDDPTIQLIARRGLAKQGFDVTVAGDGHEALRLVEQDQPDVVVLDWQMPGLDGPDVCRALKANPRVAHIPVVFLTAQDSATEEAMAVGAAGIVRKPFDPRDLGAKVLALLSA